MSLSDEVIEKKEFLFQGGIEFVDLNSISSISSNI
jgi:hypothetical protein